MSQPTDARQLFDAAEQAAAAGDFHAAYDLLGSAARVQEAELGPVHPDLASTLNNLAIVAEKTGRIDAAETFYRRAAAIASASLPADHPMVADSRQNLEDFCRASGRPIDGPVVTTPAAAPRVDVAPAAAPVVAATAAPKAPALEREPDAGHATPATLPTPAAAAPRADRPPAPAVSQRPPAPPKAPPQQPASRSRAWIAIGAVALVAGALLVTRPWSSREPAGSAPAAAPAPAPPAEQPAPRVSAEPPVSVPTQPAPQPPPRRADRDAVPTPPPAQAPAAVPVTLDTADLCVAFSRAGGAWRCEPAGDSVAPGSVVFYTRVRSSRDTAVVHRWYRGNALRQSVRLTIRANPATGYRTYSRQTVDAGTDWRVEVRSANGDLLQERRFTVR